MPWKNADTIRTVVKKHATEPLGMKVLANRENKVIRFYSDGRSFPNDIHSIWEGSCTPEARYNPHVL